MSNVIKLEMHIRLLNRLKEKGDTSYELFLLNEGLDLLANFRSIKSDEQRTAIANLIENVARSD